jgi:hypothetical protein
MMELDKILEIVFVVLAAVPVFVSGGAIGNLVSAAVDLVKAVVHALGKEFPAEWGGRLFLILNFVAFVVVFAATGVNPAEYVLPDQTAETLVMVVNIVAAVTGLLGSLALGDLIHKLAKKFAPLLVSGTARSAVPKA